MRIREMRAGDGEDVARIQLEMSWMVWLQGRDAASLGAELEGRISAMAERATDTALVAEIDGLAVGYAVAHWQRPLALPAPEGYLGELFVLEEFRGRGAGSALLERVVELARERGCFRVRLINGKESEAYLRGFYLRCGFAEREHIRDFCLML
ncbi:MAG: GNAT family N-acetyltransferase [Desulfovibrionaceae bacterium]